MTNTWYIIFIVYYVLWLFMDLKSLDQYVYC